MFSSRTEPLPDLCGFRFCVQDVCLALVCALSCPACGNKHTAVPFAAASSANKLDVFRLLLKHQVSLTHLAEPCAHSWVEPAANAVGALDNASQSCEASGEQCRDGALTVSLGALDPCTAPLQPSSSSAAVHVPLRHPSLQPRSFVCSCPPAAEPIARCCPRVLPAGVLAAGGCCHLRRELRSALGHAGACTISVPELYTRLFLCCGSVMLITRQICAPLATNWKFLASQKD